MLRKLSMTAVKVTSLRISHTLTSCTKTNPIHHNVPRLLRLKEGRSDEKRFSR